MPPEIFGGLCTGLMNTRQTFVLLKSEPLVSANSWIAGGDHAEVEFFDSPFGPRIHRRSFKVAEFRATTLGLQTRVFWQEKSSGVWRAGRIDGPPVIPEIPTTAEDWSPIRFPNHNDRNIPVSELYVRWSKPITDPAEFLASQVSDTPFLCRWPDRGSPPLSRTAGRLQGLDRTRILLNRVDPASGRDSSARAWRSCPAIHSGRRSWLG